MHVVGQVKMTQPTQTTLKLRIVEVLWTRERPMREVSVSGIGYRWLASPAATRWLNLADWLRGTLSDFH